MSPVAPVSAWEEVDAGLITHATVRMRRVRPWAWWVVIGFVAVLEVERSVRTGRPTPLLAIVLVSTIVTLVVLGILRRGGRGGSLTNAVAGLVRPLMTRQRPVVVMALDQDGEGAVQYGAVIVDPRPWPAGGAWLPGSPLQGVASAEGTGAPADPVALAAPAALAAPDTAAAPAGPVAPAVVSANPPAPEDWPSGADPNLLASEESTGDGVDLVWRLRTEPSRLVGRRLPLGLGQGFLLVRRIEPSTPEGRAPAPAILPARGSGVLLPLVVLGLYLLALALVPQLR